jgi:aspartate-semialdehyde dehydrogenase
MVDNSSAFRMTEGVPLVIPEVNPEAMAHVRWGKGKGQKGAIIANPNCSTIIALMAVTPIHKKATVSVKYSLSDAKGSLNDTECSLSQSQLLHHHCPHGRHPHPQGGHDKCKTFPGWCHVFPEGCGMFPGWCHMFPEGC